MSFFGRQYELDLLNSVFQRQGAQFLILYGRRRVGKTRLIVHWGSGLDVPFIYWMASQTSVTNQLRDFSQTLLRFFQPDLPVDPAFSYSTWETAMAEVIRFAGGKRLLLVLDEFTYVMQANPEVPSLIQRVWDHQLKQSQLFLVLTGSLAGIIQRTALDYQSPLYGRATARLKLQPLNFGELAAFLPGYNVEQRVAVYAITGGVPAYVELFDDRLTLLQNLRQRLLTPLNTMLEDAVFLLGEQLTEPGNYMAILEAIASGEHTLTVIANHAGIARSNITKYLAVLQELGYVERLVPATVRHPAQSRKGRYVITDAYLRFYFRFLRPYLPDIMQGKGQQAIALLHDHLLDFIGSHTFEELCREWLGIKASLGELSFLPDRIGSHWSSTAQVDVVGINWRTKDLLLGECKWGQGLVGKGVLETLVHKTDKVLPAQERWQVHYLFFARHGFTQPAQEYAAERQATLVTLSQLEADMRRWLTTRVSGQ